MKLSKLKGRTFSVLILVFLAVFGLGFYVVRYIIFGEQWASAPFNSAIFTDGVLTAGRVVDRNGVVLADVDSAGNRTFAASEDVRRSTLHAVGDKYGNIGTGALSVFAAELAGFDLISGSYSPLGTSREIALTIDASLNNVALRALDGRRGVVMVSNYLTGDILVMVSNPTFDQYNPPISPDPQVGVYVNRAIQSAYTPGSIYKIVTAAAAIDNFDDIFDRTWYCTGELHTGRGIVTCPRAHGHTDIVRGMRVSCNIVYGELALELGGETLEAYARSFGLSESTRIGSVMTTASGNFDVAPPNTADLAWSGVGQHTNTVCPASMLRFVGAIANDGVAVELQIRERTGLSRILPVPSSRILDRNTARELAGIIEIQNRDMFPGLDIYAKSGTAEVGGGLDPHAWYVGYINNEGFPLAFVVIVENGGGGFAVASPIANTVLQAAIRR